MLALTITLTCNVFYIYEMIDNISVTFGIRSIDNHCCLQFGIFFSTQSQVFLTSA